MRNCGMRRKEYYDAPPDATPDFRVKGGHLGGCPVFDAAVAYWRSDRAKPAGATYEDVIRQAYITEGRKTDGLVVSLATGNSLTDGEVMATDLYELSVMWDDGVFSKQFTKGHVVIKDRAKSPADIAAERRAMYPHLPDKPNMYEGPPCRVCSQTVRYYTGGCVACSKKTGQRWAAKSKSALSPHRA